jgi:hypothetical protein
MWAGLGDGCKNNKQLIDRLIENDSVRTLSIIDAFRAIDR